MNVINFNAALNSPLLLDNTAPSPAGTGDFAKQLSGAAEDLPSDTTTAGFASLLGGTPVYQSGLQSGTGPFAMPNYDQIRLSDGTLVAAAAAQYNIELVGLDRYKEQLSALQAFNASTGYTDPALNVPESQRYTAVQQALGPVLAGPEPRASASVAGPDPEEPRPPATGAISLSENTPPHESLSASLLDGFAASLQRFGIEK